MGNTPFTAGGIIPVSVQGTVIPGLKAEWQGL
jgi:hypothetical protein